MAHIDDDRDYIIKPTSEDLAGLHAVQQYERAQQDGPTYHLLATAGLDFYSATALTFKRESILAEAINTEFKPA